MCLSNKKGLTVEFAILISIVSLLKVRFAIVSAFIPAPVID